MLHHRCLIAARRERLRIQTYASDRLFGVQSSYVGGARSIISDQHTAWVQTPTSPNPTRDSGSASGHRWMAQTLKARTLDRLDRVNPPSAAPTALSICTVGYEYSMHDPNIISDHRDVLIYVRAVLGSLLKGEMDLRSRHPGGCGQQMRLWNTDAVRRTVFRSAPHSSDETTPPMNLNRYPDNNWCSCICITSAYSSVTKLRQSVSFQSQIPLIFQHLSDCCSRVEHICYFTLATFHTKSHSSRDHECHSHHRRNVRYRRGFRSSVSLYWQESYRCWTPRRAT